MSPAKTAELITMSFAELAHLGALNHVLDGGQHWTNPFIAAWGDM